MARAGSSTQITAARAALAAVSVVVAVMEQAIPVAEAMEVVITQTHQERSRLWKI
jgi:hypothetical protein